MRSSVRSGRRLLTRMRTSVLLMLVTMSVSGCVASTSATMLDDYLYCDWSKPIYWAEGDTDATVDQITEHNLRYDKLCN